MNKQNKVFFKKSKCFFVIKNKATIRKNLREFKGFDFDRNSNEYQKHLNNLIKYKHSVVFFFFL